MFRWALGQREEELYAEPRLTESLQKTARSCNEIGMLWDQFATTFKEFEKVLNKGQSYFTMLEPQLYWNEARQFFDRLQR